MPGAQMPLSTLLFVIACFGLTTTGATSYAVALANAWNVTWLQVSPGAHASRAGLVMANVTQNATTPIATTTTATAGLVGHIELARAL